MDQKQIQSLLEALLGSRNVYHQPPSGHQMNYPAITYVRSDVNTKFANNLPYLRKKRYTVTLITKTPEHPALEKLGDLPLSSFDRHFAAGGLNHDVFAIYF